MSDFARGGYIGPSENIAPLHHITNGCDYIIPVEFAMKWRDHLERINEAFRNKMEEELDTTDEGGVE